MTAVQQKSSLFLQKKTPSLPNISQNGLYNNDTLKNSKISNNKFNGGDQLTNDDSEDPRFVFPTVASDEESDDDDLEDDLDVEPEQDQGQDNGSLNLRVLPQSVSNQQLSAISSIDHSNLSFIDMYGDRHSQDDAQHSNIEPSTNSLDNDNNDNTVDGSHPNNDTNDNNDERQVYEPTQRSSTATYTGSTNDLSTIKSSRQSATKIRTSIEENRTDLSSNRDRYGFKKKSNFISEDRYNEWWLNYSKHCTRRKAKWENLLLKNGLNLNNDNPLRFPARSEKLKRYIRKGLPAEWRGNAWWYFAKGPEKLKNNLNVYDNLVESTVNLHNKDTEIIERDLNRTFPDNIHFKPEPSSHPPPVSSSSSSISVETPLIQALRRVLVAFSVYQPAIGYCQSLNFIAGLLLIFMDEEKAFWMLVIITTRYLPGVHDVNLEGVNIDQGVLMLALREFIPDVWEKIISIDFGGDPTQLNSSVDNNGHDNKKGSVNNEFLTKLPPITLCTSSWFMSVFIGILPIETTLRVWDCLIYEDSNFLFKISLSIFKLIEPKILNLHDEMEIFQIVQNTPKTLIDPNSLFEIIFKKKLGFNNLTQDEVNRCKKYVSDKRNKSSNNNSNKKNKNHFDNDPEFNRALLSDALWQPDLYGFKKGLSGVHWNNNLTRRMRLPKRR